MDNQIIKKLLPEFEVETVEHTLRLTSPTHEEYFIDRVTAEEQTLFGKKQKSKYIASIAICIAGDRWTPDDVDVCDLAESCVLSEVLEAIFVHYQREVFAERVYAISDETEVILC